MLRRAAVVLAFALVSIPVSSSGSADAVTIVAPTPRSANAQSDLIALINAYRTGNGLQALSANGALTAAAGWMAGDMAARNYIGHVSSDGRSPTQRMSAFGYPATSMYTGEDLGAGYASAGAVLIGWQASSAHNAVLLNPNYDAVGIGVVYQPGSTYKWYWAADFGGPGGTVKVVVPPVLETQSAPARAVAAPRGPAPQALSSASIDTVDPEAAARAARIAFIEELAARRIAHLFAVLLRMGAI